MILASENPADSGMIRSRANAPPAEVSMRRTLTAPILLAAALFAAGCQSGGTSTPAPAKPAASDPPKDKTVFEPATGVRCDRSKDTCEWKGGASVGLTRLFFGDGPADGLMPTMAPEGYRYDPIFKPGVRSSCDTLVTTCYDEAGANADLTNKYFGRKAADRLAKRPRTIQRYGEFITCDRVSDVCYDRLGAGVGITRLYIGEPQSDALRKRLRSNL